MPILSGNAAGRTVEPIEPQRFSLRHQTLTHTDNPIEWLNRELRYRSHVVGSFPDDNSALMLFCIRLRHVAGTQEGQQLCMNTGHLEAPFEDTSLRKIIDAIEILAINGGNSRSKAMTMLHLYPSCSDKKIKSQKVA